MSLRSKSCTSYLWLSHALVFLSMLLWVRYFGEMDFLNIFLIWTARVCHQDCVQSLFLGLTAFPWCTKHLALCWIAVFPCQLFRFYLVLSWKAHHSLWLWAGIWTRIYGCSRSFSVRQVLCILVRSFSRKMPGFVSSGAFQFDFCHRLRYFLACGLCGLRTFCQFFCSHFGPMKDRMLGYLQNTNALGTMPSETGVSYQSFTDICRSILLSTDGWSTLRLRNILRSGVWQRSPISM